MGPEDWLHDHIRRAFSNQYWPLDVLRVAEICVSVVAFGMMLGLLSRANARQRLGILGLISYGCAAVGNEVERLGMEMSFRLPFNLVGCACAVAYLVYARREWPPPPQSPWQVRRHNRGPGDG